jgi:hypothetical protein
LKTTSKFKQAVGNILLLELFPVFFILHGYNENFGLIPFSVLVNLFAGYSIVVIFLFIVSLLALKNNQAAFVFSFILLFLFFFFGFFHDSLKSLISNKFLQSYKFILCFITILIVGLFFLFRRKNDFVTAKKYIVVLLSVFLLIEFVSTGYNLITKKGFKNNLSRDNRSSIDAKKNCSTEKPDIFFVVFDEYTSSKGLKKYFNFDNQLIDSQLASAGFFVSTDSRSNYNMTPFSLASSFNFNYLNLPSNDSIVSQATFLKAIQTFKKNKLTVFLKQQGYEIIDNGCFEIDNSVFHMRPYFETLPKDIIDNQTIISRIKRDIGWNFTLKNILTGDLRIPRSYKKNKTYHIYRNNLNFKNAIDEMTKSGSNPKFVYAHLMMPHDPYFFDSTGQLISDTVLVTGRFDRKAAYLSQLVYANKLLVKMIKAASTKTGRPRVVIIEGDHGFGFHDCPKFKDREFRNLNAYYFSDLDYHTLYSSISPVNTFRVILNKYFCCDYPLLDDSSFYLQQKK